MFHSTPLPVPQPSSWLSSAPAAGLAPVLAAAPAALLRTPAPAALAAPLPGVWALPPPLPRAAALPAAISVIIAATTSAISVVIAAPSPTTRTTGKYTSGFCRNNVLGTPLLTVYDWLLTLGVLRQFWSSILYHRRCVHWVHQVHPLLEKK